MTTTKRTHRGQPAPAPLITSGAIVALVEAVLVALTAFGVAISPEQHAAVIGLVVALLAVAAPLVAILWQRHRVTANGDVVEKIVGGTVVAGEGSELPTGKPIREAGSLDV